MLRIELDDRVVFLALSDEEAQRVAASVECVRACLTEARREQEEGKARRGHNLSSIGRVIGGTISPIGNEISEVISTSGDVIGGMISHDMVCEETGEYRVRNRDVGRVVEMARRAMARGSLAEVGAFFSVYQEANTEFELDDIIAEMQAWVRERLSGKAECAATAPASAPATVNAASAPAGVRNAVAACFEEGLLDAQKPFQLCFLLLAMRARRRWMGREITAFVAMVKEQYPPMEQFYGRTEEQIVWSIKHVLAKSQHYFYDIVNDQATLIAYIDELYPLKRNGERRKEGDDAQNLAEKLRLRV